MDSLELGKLKSRYFRRGILVTLGIFIILFLFIGATVTIPNVFNSGDTISASKMNQNFDALKNGIGDHTTGYMPFWNSSNVFADSGLFWDSDNGRLGIGTSSPNSQLNILSGNGQDGKTFFLSHDFASYPFTMGVARNNGYGWLGANAIQSTGDTQIYSKGSAPSWIIKPSGAGSDMTISVAPPGTAGNTISWIDALIIKSNGNVGIGTTNPAYRFEVSGNGFFSSSIQSDGNIVISTGQITTNSVANPLRLGVDGVEKMKITSNGDVYVGANIVHTSDSALKEKILQINNSLEKINKINGVTFYWKNKIINEKQIGIIAQDVEKVFPELVKEGDNGIKSVNYSGLIAPTIEAVKELKNENDKLKQEKDQQIAKLTKENEDLKNRLAKIEQMLNIK